MFRYLKNDLIHYWVSVPEANAARTIKFLFDNGLIGDRSSSRLESMESLIKYIVSEKKEFMGRVSRKTDWIDELPRDSIPCGANPFMEEFDGSEC